MSTATITSWLLTYLIHSTALLGAAWLVVRFLGSRQLALQEVLLRTALIGGLLTATLQVGFGIQPVGGALAIADLSQTEIVAARTTSGVIASDFALSPTPALSSRTPASWPIALISIWALGSMLTLLTLGRSILDLRRLLKTRHFRPSGRLLDRLAKAMGLRKSVRLSTSAAIAVPFATGIRQPEICCPERVGDLAFEHQKSLFAHELAHLVRRDPAWQLLYRLGEAILFLQPLNRLVRRRLEEIAEHLTDERAVACTGDRLGLARCLVVVAHWGISDVPGVPATAFASGPRLDRRVRHLISGAAGQHRNARWTAPLLIALMLGSVVLLPVIAPSAVHADISPTNADTVAAQTWSTSTDDPEAVTPAPPAPPSVSPSSDVSPPVAPATDIAPAPDVAPRPAAEPRPVTAPTSANKPAPATAPGSAAMPLSPAPPTAPEPPSKADTPVPENLPERERARTRDEALSRQREEQRERSEDQARSREQAREAAERSRLTEAEREKLRDEVQELRKQAEVEAREHMLRAREYMSLTDAEREKLWAEVHELRKQTEAEAREHMRQAKEQMRLTEAEREEMMRRTAELHAEWRELALENAREAKEKSRELAERARRLAEEAEAERLAEEKRRQQQKPE
jgi:beta-lactamase regulating signal transducer with metallopeptidase domain